MHASAPTDPSYGYTAQLRGVPFDEARARIVDALGNEGFGVPTEIDVKSTLKAKLDRESRRHVIPGACNPQWAHRALEAELGIGLLLPCNVCVWEEEGGSVVSIARPEAMFELVNRQDVQPVAGEADQRLRHRDELWDQCYRELMVNAHSTEKPVNPSSCCGDEPRLLS